MKVDYREIAYSELHTELFFSVYTQADCYRLLAQRKR